MFKKIIILSSLSLMLAAGLVMTNQSSADATSFGVSSSPAASSGASDLSTNDYEISCYGCLSPETGKFRFNYVKPHFRSNGTFVDGYWRS